MMLTPDELELRLNRFPRLELIPGPAPLEPLPNLSRRPDGPELWVKREDALGPGMGGNKARKLDYLLADAQKRGKRRVITFGGLQSNHARMTAAACAQLGLEAHLFFFEERPQDMPGNLMLDSLFGAQLHFFPLGSSGSRTLEATNRLVRLLALARLGPGAYFIPVGGHNVRGCLGYVRAALEIQRQLEEADLLDKPLTLVTACGTGGTLAGLWAGFRLLDSRVRVLGIDVGRLWQKFPTSIARLAANLCKVLKAPLTFKPETVPLIEGFYVGPRYAAFTPAAARAILCLAREEGLLLDPVYTGKAFAGLLDLIKYRYFRSGERVVFLHTGGGPGLWAYTAELATFLDELPPDGDTPLF